MMQECCICVYGCCKSQENHTQLEWKKGKKVTVFQCQFTVLSSFVLTVYLGHNNTLCSPASAGQPRYGTTNGDQGHSPRFWETGKTFVRRHL